MSETAYRGTAFEDSAAPASRDRGAAVAFVWRHARRFLLTRAQFEASVIEAIDHGYLYSRAFCRVVRRTTELAVTMAPNWAGPVAALSDRRAFDPWLYEDEDIARAELVRRALPRVSPSRRRSARRPWRL